MKQLESVAWVFQRDAKVLCVRTRGKDKCFIPGGKIEPGETRQQALLREIKEELGVDLDADSISFEFTVEDAAYGLEGTALAMHCFSAAFAGQLAPCAEIEVVEWVDNSNLALCAPAARQAVVKVLGLGDGVS